MIENILYYTFLMISTKSIVIGSDFSFYHWFKYGKKYSDWYFNRETFLTFLEKEK